MSRRRSRGRFSLFGGPHRVGQQKPETPPLAPAAARPWVTKSRALLSAPPRPPRRGAFLSDGPVRLADSPRRGTIFEPRKSGTMRIAPPLPPAAARGSAAETLSFAHSPAAPVRRGTRFFDGNLALYSKPRRGPRRGVTRDFTE